MDQGLDIRHTATDRPLEHALSLRSAGLMEGELGGESVLAVADKRLDTGYVYLNPDGERFDDGDGTVTDADGTEYAPDALPLERVHTFDAMWFAWSGYYPETTVYA